MRRKLTMKKLLYVMSLLIVASMILAACGPAATPETIVVTKEVIVTKEVQLTAEPAAPGNTTADGKILVRWSVGAGTGADPAQIPIENEVVADFNASQDKIKLILEVIPNASAQDTLATEFAAGAGPDIVGPIGWVGANTFYGQWLDIGPYLEASNYDTSKFEPALVKMYQTDPTAGTSGLPFAVYPSAIYYNTGLFDEAGLSYPPAKYGDKYVMPDGSEVEWSWDTVKTVAQMLTIDSAGKNALDPAFDKTKVVQYGFSWQWEDKPSYWGSFQKTGPDETFLVPGGAAGSYQARIPDAWKSAWKWYYEGMWGAQPYVPNGAIEGSADFNSGNSFASGKIAMAELPSWYLCCIGALKDAGGKYNFGAMPVFGDGNVYGRVDADTFRIWKGSPNPEAAFQVMTYLVDVGIQKLVVGTPDKAPAYGAIPSDSSLRGPWLEAAKANHPSVTDDGWNILLAGLNYPDAPSAEGYMPNMNESWARTVVFGNLLKTSEGVDIDKEAETMRSDLEVIFNK
jgi:multiple sugar transport system substrate-binding protein